VIPQLNCEFDTVLGYFLYDTLDIVVHHRIVEKWEILIHHFAVSFSYIIIL